MVLAAAGGTLPTLSPRRMPVSTKPVEDDVDVASERQRVLRGDADNDMVKIENLTKVGLRQEGWGSLAACSVPPRLRAVGAGGMGRGRRRG